MSNFTQEPRNWRNVAKVEHRGVTGCAVIIPQSDEKNIEVFYGCEQICSECKMCGANPDRASYIQSCKDRLQKEEKAMSKELYDLTKIGSVLSLEPVYVEYGPSAKNHRGRLVHIYESHYPRYGIITDDGVFMRFTNVKHITPKRTRAMTADEIAMLPRGTAFVTAFGCTIYSPRILLEENGEIRIGEYGIDDVKYRLPGETEIRKFEVEE